MIRITPSQASWNTLTAGVSDCYNVAQFLGHRPGQHGARGPVEIGPGAGEGRSFESGPPMPRGDLPVVHDGVVGEEGECFEPAVLVARNDGVVLQRAAE